jgi:hypothetical protein
VVNVFAPSSAKPIASKSIAQPERVGTGAAGAGPMNRPKTFGKLPTDTVFVTVLLAVAITETLLLLTPAT